MKPPLTVQLSSGILGVVGGLTLLVALALEPAAYPHLTDVFQPAVVWAPLALASLATLTVAAVSLWWGKRWAQRTLLTVSGLAVVGLAWNGTQSPSEWTLVLIPLSIFGLTALAARSGWRVEDAPRYPNIVVAIMASALFGAAWLLLAFPVTSLYTGADGATLRRDAGLGATAGLVLLGVGGARLRSSGRLGLSIASIALAGFLTVLLVLHAQRASVSTVNLNVIDGEGAFFAFTGVFLVASALATGAWLAAEKPDIASILDAAAGLALAVGATVVALCAFVFVAAPSLEAAAKARLHTPGFEVVMLLVIVLVALAKGRPRAD